MHDLMENVGTPRHCGEGQEKPQAAVKCMSDWNQCLNILQVDHFTQTRILLHWKRTSKDNLMLFLCQVCRNVAVGQILAPLLLLLIFV
jgi:hypothetical protein